MRHLLVLVARLALAAILLFAGGVKAVSPHEAVQSVGGFHLLPSSLALWLGVVLPGVEVVVGAALVTGLALRGAALLSAGMALMFAGAVLSAMSRSLDISCGCFGELALSPRADATTLTVDLVMLLLAAVVYSGSRPTAGASAPAPAAAR